MTRQTHRSPAGHAKRWLPIAHGTLEHGCRQAVFSIGQDLLRPIETWRLHNEQPNWVVRAVSLASGRAGTALFLHEFAHDCGSPDYANRAIELLNESADALANMVADSSLYCGFTGLGWVTNYVQGAFAKEDQDDDSTDEIDQALCKLLESSPWGGLHDLIGGLTGIGIYLVSRLPKPSARRGLALIVSHLSHAAIRDDHGITWEVPHLRQTDPDSPRLTRGRIDLGVSHGVPGIIGLLGLIVANDPTDEAARDLLRSAVRWLIEKGRHDHQDSVFPHFVDPDIHSERIRSAWCYGDVGVAAVLFNTAIMTDNQELRDAALAIGRITAARRSVYSPTPLDSGLCHGLAGLVHVYNRFFQGSREEVFRSAALYWLERLLECRNDGEGVGGFRAWSLELDRSGAWESDPCFLTGAAGIGLALLASLSDTPPRWDSVLLLGPPPYSD